MTPEKLLVSMSLPKRKKQRRHQKRELEQAKLREPLRVIDSVRHHIEGVKWLTKR